MADVKIIDIKGSKWNFKDEAARTRIETVERKVDKNFTYSTEEVDTGEKWIDGKPIYRKVLNISPKNLYYWERIPETDNLSIKKIISAKAMGTDGPYTDCEVSLYVLKYQDGTFGFSAYNWAIVATEIILEYTKTSD